MESQTVDIFEFAKQYSSPFEWLMVSLCPSGVPQEKLVAMMTAYFDASGAPDDQPFVVVAGFVANFMQWQLFEMGWNKLHDQFGLERPFHMTTFMSRDKPNNKSSQYAKWSMEDPQAIDFQTKLGSAIQLSCLMGFSCIVPMEIYKNVSSAFPLEKVVPPYALAARTCVASLHKWQVECGIAEIDVELIFEKGDLGQGKFTDLMTVSGMQIPIYKGKDDYPGLQAADMMAWEQSFHLKRELRNDHQLPRAHFSWLLHVPHSHRVVTQEMLVDLCHINGIDPRTGFRK